MSQENVEIVRGVYAEWARGNFRAGAELYDREVVLAIRDEFPEPGVYAGRDQIRAYMQEFLAGWSDCVIEAEEIVPAGDKVAVAIHQRATGTASGIPVEMRYWQLWTFRGSAVTRIESIKTRAEAYEAAGIRE